MIPDVRTRRIALVTGGSSGIGLAIAHELAKRGFALLLVSNQPESLERCRIAIEALHHVACLTLSCDLALASSARQVFDFCRRESLEVAILVNNAGMLVFSEVATAPIEKVDAILQLHVYAPTMLCRLFAEEMKQRGRGHILNVSSISSVMPYPGISLYGPSKTYLRYFSRALRSEMKMYGVNVTCLIPGATATALYDPNRVNIPLARKLGVMHAPEFVARKAVGALLAGRAECIPGWINKLLVFAMPWIPDFLVHLLHRKTDWVDKGNDALG